MWVTMPCVLRILSKIQKFCISVGIVCSSPPPLFWLDLVFPLSFSVLPIILGIENNREFIPGRLLSHKSIPNPYWNYLYSTEKDAYVPTWKLPRENRFSFLSSPYFVISIFTCSPVDKGPRWCDRVGRIRSLWLGLSPSSQPSGHFLQKMTLLRCAFPASRDRPDRYHHHYHCYYHYYFLSGEVFVSE